MTLKMYCTLQFIIAQMILLLKPRFLLCHPTHPPQLEYVFSHLSLQNYSTPQFKFLLPRSQASPLIVPTKKFKKTQIQVQLFY